MPDYASHLGADQSAYANQFSEMTNPFLNARGVQSEILPWQQQALAQKSQAANQSYQEGMLGVDQARQKLAQTAQDTLLPLQANQIAAQTSALTAETAGRQYQLDTQKAGMDQFPDFMKAVGDAVNNNDPTALSQAIGQNPQAVRVNPQLAMDAFNKINQSKQFETQGIIGAAQGMGADYVSMNPGASVGDIVQNYKPSSPNLTPAQQVAEKNAYLQGATHNQVQIQATAAKGQITEAVAELRQTGQISAATQRALGSVAAKGLISPQSLAALDIDPQTQSQLLAALGSKPNGSGSVVPDKIAVSNLTTANKILSDPIATTAEKSWAYDALNTHGNPSYQFPVYPAPIQDKIDSLTSQINNLQTSLPSRSTHSWSGDSDYDKTNKQITDLRNQVTGIKNQYAPPQATQGSATPADDSNPDQVSIPSPAASFGANSFGAQDLGGGVSIPPPTDQDVSGVDLTNAASQGQPTPAINIPGSPATSAALQQQAAKTAPKAAPKPMAKPSPEDVAYLAQNRSPQTIQMFESRFGPGSASKALQAYSSTTKTVR